MSQNPFEKLKKVSSQEVGKVPVVEVAGNLTDKQKEDIVFSAVNLEDLRAKIDTIGQIKAKDGFVYSASDIAQMGHDLLAIVELLKSPVRDMEKIDFHIKGITRAYGMRDKVRNMVETTKVLDSVK